MKLIYDASNSVEAHMLMHLLDGAGICARIDGEYLQGGIGDLQAIGLVRVMVENADYDQAKLIVKEFDAKQPVDTIEKILIKETTLWPLILSFVIGFGIAVIYYQTPVSSEGIDYDGDGSYEERWIYYNDRISKVENDTNFDGIVDLIYKYDQKGLLKSSISDQNYDGNFETKIFYVKGNAVRRFSDSTGDGFNDYRVTYRNGLVDKVTYYDVRTKQAIKVDYYGAFKLKRSELDTNEDGLMDQTNYYDSLQELIKNHGTELK